MSAGEVKTLVNKLPAGTGKQVSLAVLKSPATKYRIDHNGYPAWTWRGEGDLGACIHVDPKTGKPYLETQYETDNRKTSPKYIDFGTDGDEWMCRIHTKFGPFEREKNWSNSTCDAEGRHLLRKLRRALKR